MRLIVNADDFGMSSIKNRAIVECLSQGYCTQCSIVMNCGETTREAVRLAASGGFANRVSLHINLSLGSPMTRNIRSHPIYCARDTFSYDPWNRDVSSLIRNITPRHVDVLAEELEAQILAYLDAGFTLRRADSHNWIQFNLPVWLALRPLLRKYGFRSIRGIRPAMLTSRTWRFAAYYRSMYRLAKGTGLVNVPFACNVHELFSEPVVSQREEDTREIILHPTIVERELVDEARSGGRRKTDRVRDVLSRLQAFDWVDAETIH